MSKNDDKLLKSFPVQLVEIENGLILKRGNLITKLQGKWVSVVVRKIIELTCTEAFSIKQILDVFPENFTDLAKGIINDLIARDILYEPSEMSSMELPHGNVNADTFYWNFKTTTRKVHEKLSSKKIAIVGVNFISKQMKMSLRDMDINTLHIIDDPHLRNDYFFNSGCDQIDPSKWEGDVSPMNRSAIENFLTSNKIDCLIATSDHGGISLMKDWQQICYDQGIDFFPIVLQDLIGFIGPIVVPKQTACYNCFISRCDSNNEDYATLREIEAHSFEEKRVAGFIPPMATLLGDFAIIELSKFYGGWCFANILTNAFLRLNMLDNRLVRHRILKVPRCSLCSPINYIPELCCNKKSYFE